MINCWELVEVGDTVFPVLLCNHVTLGAGFPFATQLMFSGSPILSKRGASSSSGSTMTGATIKKKKKHQTTTVFWKYLLPASKNEPTDILLVGWPATIYNWYTVKLLLNGHLADRRKLPL